MTLVIALGYWLTQPPLYNPAGSIDPWLYTALFVNFDQTYEAFVTTYYPSRLPLIVPGYVLNLLFDPTTAYFLLHGIFFFAGGMFVYLLVRTGFGRIPALAAYAWMTGSQMYFDAHRWDYWDGTIITYLAAALYFGLTPPRRVQLRILWLALAGFFVAAAIATNLYVLALAVPLPLIYVALAWAGSVSALARRAAVDVPAFVGGLIMLFVGGGIFAAANGGKFWFIGPQIEATRVINNADYKQQYSAWLPQEPRVIVPLLLIVLIGA
ncbi:MAG: hypothetical protein H0V68_00870, partial [Actinobacteria bacterium]|nr:hypothetical protein [Actinomycetota bacterium]